MGSSARKFKTYPDGAASQVETPLPNNVLPFRKRGALREVDVDLDNGISNTRGAVANVLSGAHGAPHAEPAPANNTTWFGKIKETASGIAGWGVEKGAEIQAAWREYNQVRKAYQKGEHTKEQITEATEAILRMLGVEGALTVMSWPLSKLVSWYLEARDHELHKTNPDYANLAAQFMDMHPDEDDENSYHHAVEALFAGMDERALRRTHYNAFSSAQKFRHYYGTADGRKKIKEQMAKLLGPEVDEPHELTEAIEAIAGRCHIEITGAPPAATLHAHDLQHRHANHCLHALTGILQVVYNEVTPTRLAKIMGPNEDVKLEDDLAKFGEQLRKKVKGNPDLAAQLLGKIETTDFGPFFHTLRNDTNLEKSMDDEPELVKEQLRQLFGFSSKENISDADLIAVRDEMVGTRTGTPPTFSFSGGRFGTPPTDATELAKFNAICGQIYDMAGLLLAPRTGTVTPSRLTLLYPEKTEDIKYEEFGAHLGRCVRGKKGPALGRARDAFLRGWDRQAFQDRFDVLRTATDLQAAIDTKAGKEAVKKLILELTGLQVPAVSGAQWTTRLDRLMENINCNNITGVPIPQTTPPNPTFPTLTGPQGHLGTDLNDIRNAVNTVGLDTIFAEENLERNLGAIVTSATSATLESVISKITTGMLVRNYGQLNAQFVTPGVFPANLVAYKDQLARFIGANASFTWNDANVRVLLDELDRQADKADTLFGSRVTSNKDALKNMVARIRTFLGQNYTGTTTPFFEHLQTV